MDNEFRIECVGNYTSSESSEVFTTKLFLGGPTGPTGPPGISSLGYIGPTGPPGLGYIGPTGPPGLGYIGPTGPTGAPSFVPVFGMFSSAVASPTFTLSTISWSAVTSTTYAAGGGTLTLGPLSPTATILLPGGTITPSGGPVSGTYRISLNITLTTGSNPGTPLSVGIAIVKTGVTPYVAYPPPSGGNTAAIDIISPAFSTVSLTTLMTLTPTDTISVYLLSGPTDATPIININEFILTLQLIG